MISFQQLREVNVERCPKFGHGLNEWSVLEWAGAMCGEAGEAANVAKKIRRLADGCAVNNPGTPELARKLGEELADVVIYADLLAASQGIDLGGAVANKFDEVSRRVGYTTRLSDQKQSPEAAAMAFMLRAANENSRIVCSGDLSVHQIAEAQASGKFFIASSGMGFVLLPFELTTTKDRQREADYHAKVGHP